MYYCDLHLHTVHSFDHDEKEDCSVINLCKQAIKNGLSEIAITDHYDINGIIDGFYPPVDINAIKTDIMNARELFGKKLEIVFGIELGQPAQKSEEAKRFLTENSFDFVIGSLHNNRGKEDFYFIDYPNTPRNELVTLWNNYLEETKEHIVWGRGKYHTMAHLNYLLRYYKRSGNDDIVNIPEKEEVFREIFRLLIDNNIALEINTSGLRQGLGDFIPQKSLIALYADCGGRMFTVGSDSHAPSLCGFGVPEAYDLIKSLGINHVMVPRGGSLVELTI
ncbi:MAG: histidinol-phosphatase HisJ family protein [Oscillospiraceae bacterium]|nr:histidinol-phosphatase HisJ family protein [Oscillospiraceae bacterium]